MFRHKLSKKIFSSLISGLYLFVVLFAQNIHNHGSGQFFKDFHFKSKESTFSKCKSAMEFVDCMSCHFTSENNADLPQVFSLILIDSKIHDLPSDDVQSVYLYKKRELSSQRGPPIVA